MSGNDSLTFCLPSISTLFSFKENSKKLTEKSVSASSYRNNKKQELLHVSVVYITMKELG